MTEPRLSRRSLLGAAATSVVAGSVAARVLQRAGLDDLGRPGGLSLVVAQHEVRVDRAPLATVVRASSEGALEPFVTVGVAVPWSLPAAARAQVALRTRGEAGWSPWLPAPFAPLERPDDEGGSGRLVSEPLYIGWADGLEVEVPAGLAGDVEVVLVRETPRVLGYHQDTEPAFQSLAPRPAIRPRSQWNARPRKEPYDFATRLHMAVVHHTVTPNGYSAGEVPGAIASMQAFHMDGNGWNDLGYNFVVDRFGRIWEGRGGGVERLAIGGHAYGHNTGTTGIAVLGDHHNGGAPARVVTDSVARLAAWKLGFHGVDAATTVKYTSKAAGKTGVYRRVIGHRDVVATSCPGQNLYPRLDALRQMAIDIQRGFLDVPPDAYYAEAVTWAAITGITTGVGGTPYFKPDDAVTRAQMAAFLWRLMDRPEGNPPHGFPDVPEESYYDEAVRYLKMGGVTRGIGDTGLYKPDDVVTRNQMVAFLHRISGVLPTLGRHPFPDVPADSYYDTAVTWAATHGITTGVGDTGLFKPEDTVTRGQMAAFLYRLASAPQAWSPLVPHPTTVLV